MYQWETSSFNLLQQKKGDIQHLKQTFALAKEQLEIIYAKYLTQKERAYTSRYNTLGSDTAYDNDKEKIVSFNHKSNSRIEVETYKSDIVSQKNQYVFLIESGEWKLDHKKTFWNDKGKWESTLI